MGQKNFFADENLGMTKRGRHEAAFFIAVFPSPAFGDRPFALYLRQDRKLGGKQ